MCQDRASTHSAIQVEDRGAVVDCDFACRIHPEGVAGDVVCQPRKPASNKEEKLDEMNGEQGAAEGRTAERGCSLIMLDKQGAQGRGVKIESSIWDDRKSPRR